MRQAWHIQQNVGMGNDFTYNVFLSHSSKDKAEVRPLAERLRKDGLKVWLDEWEIPVAASRQSAAFSPERKTQEKEDGGALPGRRYSEKIEEGLEHSQFGFRICAARHIGECIQLELGS